MDESACVGMRRGQPKAEDERIRRLLGIDRLPRIGQRTTPGLVLETLRDIGNGNVEVRDVGERRLAIERDPRAKCTEYKVLNEISALV
jgi:hypothetical protein